MLLDAWAHHSEVSGCTTASRIAGIVLVICQLCRVRVLKLSMLHCIDAWHIVFGGLGTLNRRLLFVSSRYSSDPLHLID